ncbi:MAG: amidohydrolase family protein [Rudaea sp.]|uniref:amidohydrolase family protein n=1 Tax=Rudaea sp. TaxID=2136325 RepID=UPI0039E3EF58
MKSALAAIGFFLFLFPFVPTQGQTLALQVGKVYPSPDAKPLTDAAVLVRDGRIVAVGRDGAVPGNARVLRCAQCSVFAGFWNTHVHFMEPRWEGVDKLSADRLSGQLREMLTRSGFTTVVDTGSDPYNTAALRRRIESGEIPGPKIYTAGLPLYPHGALPFYLHDLPPPLLATLPQPGTPADATDAIEKNIAAGTDIVKLFTGSIVAPGQVVPMPVDIAQAAVATAHARRQIVFTHATNLAGVQVALSAGVDVIAHAPEVTDGVSDELLKTLVRHHVAIVPTLKLFSKDANIGAIRATVKRFHDLGGTLMYGTDTGFLTDHDQREEYEQLKLCGFALSDVVAMLTTAPAERFGVARDEGRIKAGMEGDLTVLADDPAAAGLPALADVKYTIRHGRVIYDASAVP